MTDWADKKAHSLYRYCEEWDSLITDDLLWFAPVEDISQALREAVAAERERCAQICEAELPNGSYDVVISRIEAAIRKPTED